MNFLLRYIFITILLFITGDIIFSQDTAKVISGDTLDLKETDTENLLEHQTQDAEESGLLDRLDYLEKNPIELNEADFFQLQKIPGIDAVIAGNIITYRSSHSGFKSVNELNLVDGIDNELFLNIKRYIFVGKSKTDFIRDESGKISLRNKHERLLNNFSFFIRSRISHELQPSAGYLILPDTNVSKYAGSRYKIYNKFDLKYSSSSLKLNAGLITEKDAGETSLFDFISGFAEFKSRGVIRQILAGDYTLEFGQGIVLWSSLAFSKGSDAVSNIKKKGDGIDSYTSVNEVQFFRGGAINFNFNLSSAELSFYGFFSRNNINASLDTALDQLSTMYVDGYHRTESEINRETAGTELLFGGRAEVEMNLVGTQRIGLTYYKSDYSKSFRYKGIFDFSGSHSDALGIDYDLIMSNINIFGEWARSYNGSIGGMTGFKMVFLKAADIVIALRNYPKDFIMLHSYGFGEQGGAVQNEFGIYSGIKFKIPGLAAINIYFDQYKFPYRTYYLPVPSSGNDFLFYSEWIAGKSLKLYAKYKSENKENISTVINEYGIEQESIFTRSQKNYRVQFDYDVSKSFRIRSRFEYVFADYDKRFSSEKGILFFSDFRVRFPFNLLLDGRYIIFQTDSYDTRIYEYESELNGSIANTGLYGKGNRWYLLLKYQPFNFLQLSAKYSETFIDGAKSIGSGYDEINGDLKNRLSIQLEMNF